MPFNRLAYLYPFVILAGCGSNLMPFQPGGTGSSRDLSFNFTADGGAPDAGGDGGADAGQMAAIDMAGFNMPGSPMVVITAPTPTTEVQYDNLVVTATITSPANSVIDAASVHLAITPPGGAILTAGMALTSTPNVYKGSIDISSIPSGPATFSVSASDVLGKKGSASGSYIHDHGPVITFLQPSTPTAHGTVTIEIMVQDTLHPVTDPTQVHAFIRTAGDVPLVQETGAVPMRLSATVDLNKFNPPLDGPQLINASATNPKGTVGKTTKQFIVDNTGPVMSISKPTAGTFVGGVVDVTVDITDISGVNDATVVAVWGNDPVHNALPLSRLTPGSNTFHGFFDVRSLGKSYVLPELSISAQDGVGNTSQLGEEIIVDNTTPWMTMNAHVLMRMSQLDSSQLRECTRLFYPMGYPEATGEGDKVLSIVTLRARIEDHGNFAPGLLRERYSGIDPSTVTLFVVPDNGSGVVLAVDTDNDTFCDDVNPLLVPSPQVVMSGQALSLAMQPLVTANNFDYRFVPGENPTGSGGTCSAGPGCPPTDCDYVGVSGLQAPKPLCVGTSVTGVIPYPNPAATSPIYSIAAVTTADCVGLQLDTQNTLPEGPACAVVRGTDFAGNTMVSYPLHFCIDKGLGNNPCPANWLGAIQSDCTGKWDKINKKLVAGNCIEPTAEIPHSGTEPNPGTFPKANEVRLYDTFSGGWAP